MVFLRLFSIAVAGCRKIGRGFVMRQRFKGTGSIQAGRDVFMFKAVTEKESNLDKYKGLVFSRLAIKVELLLVCIFLFTIINTSMTMMRVIAMENELQELRLLLSKEYALKERVDLGFVGQDLK